jgi:hypothetical protein
VHDVHEITQVHQQQIPNLNQIVQYQTLPLLIEQPSSPISLHTPMFSSSKSHVTERFSKDLTIDPSFLHIVY